MTKRAPKRAQRTFATALQALTLLASSQAFAYDYHPNARLYLGGGFNPERIEQGYAAGCLAPYEKQGDLAPGAGPANVHIQYVRSEVDIQKAMGVSTSSSGSYLFASGHLTSSLSEEHSFHSDSITFIIYANQHYGREYILKPKLAPELASLTPDQLISRCGPEIVTEQTLGVSILGVFTLSNVSERDKQTFEMHTGGKLDGGVLSAAAELSLKRFLQNTSTTLSISMKVYTIGGHGITELGDLLPSATQSIVEAVSAAPTTIRNYLAGMTKDHAIPITFTTMQLGQLANSALPTQDGFDNLRLTRAYERYLGVHNILTRLERILHDGDATYVQLTDADRKRLLDNLDAYADARNEMEAEGRACFGPALSRPPCRLNKIMRALPVVIWPEKKPLTDLRPPKPSDFNGIKQQCLVQAEIESNAYVAQELAALNTPSPWDRMLIGVLVTHVGPPAATRDMIEAKRLAWKDQRNRACLQEHGIN